MSSLYYANTFCSQYHATNPIFVNGAFPEQTSCVLASSLQRTSANSTSTAPFFTLTPSFSAPLPGMDTNNDSLSTQSQGRYSSTYNLGDSSLDIHCSPIRNHRLTVMCADPSSCSKTNHRYCHQQKDNLRLYPWMRSTGLWKLLILKDSAHIYVRRRKERSELCLVLFSRTWILSLICNLSQRLRSFKTLNI